MKRGLGRGDACVWVWVCVVGRVCVFPSLPPKIASWKKGGDVLSNVCLCVCRWVARRRVI